MPSAASLLSVGSQVSQPGRWRESKRGGRGGKKEIRVRKMAREIKRDKGLQKLRDRERQSEIFGHLLQVMIKNLGMKVGAARGSKVPPIFHSTPSLKLRMYVLTQSGGCHRT